jgi:tripartite-type tricarboxylate transporter receptor subunit TctC
MRQGNGGGLTGLLLALVILLNLTFLVVQAQSQEKFPTRPIDIIVGYGAGGANDLVSRVAAAYLKKKWGVPVNVINKPGGNSIPATLDLYSAATDGYTVMGDATSSTAALEVSVKNLPFKIMDRSFIGQVSELAFVIMVPTSSPFKSLKDLEVEAKRDPESFTWASQGGAGGSDILTKMFIKAIGVDVSRTKPVMSQSGAQGAALIIGGHVKMGASGMPSVIPLIKGGQVRPLAVSSKNRWPDCPDVPTIVELGHPSVVCVQWNGITGPPKLPPHIVEMWGKALEEMERDPESISRLRNIGTIPVYRNAIAFRELVMKESEEVSKLFGLKK